MANASKMDAILDNAVARCPFLARVAAAEGIDFAKALAIDPTRPAASAQRRPALEELQDYSQTYRLWHGANGFMPLSHGSGPAPAAAPKLVPSACPVLQPSAAAAATITTSNAPVLLPEPQGSRAPRPAPSAPRGLGRCTKPLPLASVSLSFGGNMVSRLCVPAPRSRGRPGGSAPFRVPAGTFGDALARRDGQAVAFETLPQAPSRGRAATRRAESNEMTSRARLALLSGSQPDFGKFLRSLQQHHDVAKQHVRRVKQQPQQPNASSSSSSTGSGASPANNKAAAGAPAPGAEGGSGLCPMRKVLGPLAPLVFNPKGHLQCPEAIVRARAALAATKPVRELRPQALPVKLLAVGATTLAVNVPCGMAREHTEKFSFGWFVAVHASIPFIAMLRKAVIMPKYAILFTIATAIAGQAMGARMERRRMQHAAAAAQDAPRAAATALPAARREAMARLVLSSARRASAAAVASPPASLALANTTASAVWAPRGSPGPLAPRGIAQAAEAFKLLLGTDGAAASAQQQQQQREGPAAAFSMGRGGPRGTKGIVLRQGRGGRAAVAPGAAPLMIEARA